MNPDFMQLLKNSSKFLELLWNVVVVRMAEMVEKLSHHCSDIPVQYAIIA